MLRILKVMDSKSVLTQVFNAICDTTVEQREKESICRRCISFMFIRDADMGTLFSEIRHLGKYDLHDETVRAAIYVWKFDDHYGLLSDSFPELELKMTMMGV